MFRIDSTGAKASLEAPSAEGGVIGYFTEGNPGLGVPATVVSAEWLNTIQEELIAILVAAGITPDKTDRNQLLEAIQALAENYSTIDDFTIANNTAVAADVTDLVFDKTEIKSAIIECDLYRKDAGQEKTSTVRLIAMYKPVLDTWELHVASDVGDDCEVEFSIDSDGQIQYTSSNYTGGSYVGTLRVTSIKRAKI